MKENKNIDINGALLDRYRRGELTSEEAHALEMASLEDPLLAEALEGFQGAQRSNEPELSYLRQWVKERVEENQASIRFIPKNRSFAPLLKVAAVFLVLIGAAWMSYLFWLQPNQNELADRGPLKATDKTSTSVQTGSSNTQKNPPIAIDSSALIATKKPETNQTQQADPASITPNLKEQPVVQSDLDVKQPIVLAAPNKDMEERKAEDLIQAMPSRSSKKLSENGISMKENINAVGAEENPAPEIGWTAFENYLNRNRVSAPTPSNTQQTFTVVLTFEVATDGRPTDFKVKRSAGDFYDQRALDLLKKGPGWIPGKTSKRGEVQVQF